MMWLAAWTIVVGGLSWEQANVEGLWVGEIQPLSGEAVSNALCADLDGDGLRDLILPARAIIQRNGRFGRDTYADIPGAERRPLADVWKNSLYLLHDDRVVRCVYRNGALIADGTFPVTWPESFLAAEFEGLESRNSPSIRRRTVLHDFDGDSQPELVVPYQRGLAVYAIRDGNLQEWGTLDVFPPPRVVATASPNLWPAAARTLTYPSRHMACLYTIADGAVLTIEERSSDAEAMSTYIQNRHLLSVNEGPIAVSRTDFIRESRVPRWVQPCRLNEDDAIDFAGGRARFTDSAALAIPLHEILVSTDGAQTTQSFRSRFLEPHCLFADINNDGRKDLVTENTRLFEGGVQDTIMRSMTSRTIDHAVAIHLQDESGRFPAAPSMGMQTTIHLAQPAYKSGPVMTRYRQGRLVNLTGDFNGDGRKDVLVETHPGRLAVWLNAGDQFILQPESIPGLRHEAFTVFDVDGDGLSDVVYPSQGGEADAPTTVLLTRGSR